MSSSAKIAVVYASTYGHVRTLAETIAEAARATGAQVDLLQFPETLPDEVLQKMHAAPRAEHPNVTPDKLKEYDGFLFGFPTRYGRATGSVSAFFDQTGGLWMTGALVGKFAGIFTSTAGQHGGQETTALTTLPFLAHHGIVYVPIGYAAQELSDMGELVGGSAWGAAAIAGGDGSRSVSDKEKKVAQYQGTSFAKLVGQFVAGKAATALQGTPVAAKAIPAQTSTPYEVNEPATKAAAPAAAGAATTATAKSEDTYAPPPVQSSTTGPAAAATTQSKAAAKPKSGLFSCCSSGASKNYDS